MTQAYWTSELNLILLADESGQRENKNVLLVLPHEYFYVKHINDCTTCSALKRPNFNSLSQYIIIMLLILRSGFSSSLSFFTFRSPFVCHNIEYSGGWSIEAEEVAPPLFFERQEGDQNIKKNI